MQEDITDDLPKEIGSAVVEWPSEKEPEHYLPDSDKAKALAIVLEAYGVLSNLSVKDRGRLIKDILDLFEVGK